MKAKVVIIILIILLCKNNFAQDIDVNFPYASAIENAEFDKAEKKIMNAYAKDSTDVMICYAAYRLYISKDSSIYDLEKAYRFLMRSASGYDSLDEKEREKFTKKNLTKNVLKADMQRTVNLGLEVAIAENTLDSYNHFLDFYSKGMTQYQRIDACNGRNALEFNEAKRINTIESYQRFIDLRPDSREFYEAELLRNDLAYKQAEAENTISSYESFVRKYPKAKEVSLAQDNIYNLAYNEAKNINTENSYRDYANKYPNSPYAKSAEEQANSMQFARETKKGDWESYKNYIIEHPNNKSLVETAEVEIYKIARKTKDIEALDYCMQNLHGKMLDSALIDLHDIYLKCNSLSLFYNKYESNIPKNMRDEDNAYKLAYILVDLDSNESISSFIETIAPRYPAYELLCLIIEDDLKARKWQNALKTVSLFEDAFDGDEDYLALKEILEAPEEKDVKVMDIGSNINTNGNEYGPVISGDDKTLYFCGKDRKDNLGKEDIYFSEKDSNGKWKKAQLISGINTEESNEAPVSISTDGTTMLLFQSGDLYVSNKTADGWSEPQKLSENINISNWQADAMITSDGQAMLFAANSKNKSEIEPSVNIFVSLRDENGNWGAPIELGPTINTPGTERSPFLHPDMKTMYFSSDRHSSLGGLDVFKTTRLSDDSWTEWSTPVNMGKEINTIESDCWYRISTDGKTAYFTKRDENIDNICWLNIPVHMRPNMVATISGKLTDKNNNPVESEIRWEDLQSGEIIGHSKTDPVDGSFFIVLPLGRIYGYYVDDESYFPISNNIDLREEESAISVEQNISIVSFKQMIDEGMAVKVNNLFFDVAKSDLLPYSLPELRRVAEIIKSRNLVVELAGHTDNTGGEEFNQNLSDRRAKSVKDFLVGEGCDPNKLITVGYGYSRPVASNETEEGRQLNRRVELRFVSSK